MGGTATAMGIGVLTWPFEVRVFPIGERAKTSPADSLADLRRSALTITRRTARELVASCAKSCTLNVFAEIAFILAIQQIILTLRETGLWCTRPDCVGTPLVYGKIAIGRRQLG